MAICVLIFSLGIGVPVALGSDFNPNAFCLSMVSFQQDVFISSNFGFQE